MLRTTAANFTPYEPLRVRGAAVDHLDEYVVGRLKHHLIIIAVILPRELRMMQWPPVNWRYGEQMEQYVLHRPLAVHASLCQAPARN
jgi:hypothetical protein